MNKKKIEAMILKNQKDLEKTIAERTSELKIKNDALQKEIQERKRIEKALRESEDKYRQLFKYAPAGIFEVDYTTRKIHESQ
jgi:C4-dicarboxylate-specific signal transduction histidine kinase